MIHRRLLVVPAAVSIRVRPAALSSFSTSTDDAAAICIHMTPRWLHCFPLHSSESLLVSVIYSVLNVWL